MDEPTPTALIGSVLVSMRDFRKGPGKLRGVAGRLLHGRCGRVGQSPNVSREQFYFRRSERRTKGRHGRNTCACGEIVSHAYTLGDCGLRTAKEPDVVGQIRCADRL